jgi:hypothetical protein
VGWGDSGGLFHSQKHCEGADEFCEKIQLVGVKRKRAVLLCVEVCGFSHFVVSLPAVGMVRGRVKEGKKRAKGSWMRKWRENQGEPA